jgi:hypothetical protein
MDINAILDSLFSVSVIGTIFTYLGGAVVLGTAIDAVVPDKYDKGFMGKLNNVPVFGKILKSIRRFSPFNIDVNKK